MTNANDIAYPTRMKDRHGNDVYYYGLTKRELFAAIAMQGLSSVVINGRLFNAENIAVMAVRHADALINELNKEKITQ
jgi:hypothetical protein